MVDVECGESECETEGMDNEACLPIYVPKYDPFYWNKTCVKFVRSSLSMKDDCSLGNCCAMVVVMLAWRGILVTCIPYLW